jgi:putative flippase GtrA
MLRALFLGKASSTRVEFLRFLPVGGVTTIIDFGLLILLTEAFGVHYLISAAVGFIAGQIWSYVICVKWIFARFSADNHVSGFTLFLMVSFIGLAITEFCLWYLTEQLELYYLFSKVVASGLSFLTLFFIRKRLLFS